MNRRSFLAAVVASDFLTVGGGPLALWLGAAQASEIKAGPVRVEKVEAPPAPKLNGPRSSRIVIDEAEHVDLLFEVRVRDGYLLETIERGSASVGFLWRKP